MPAGAAVLTALPGFSGLCRDVIFGWSRWRSGRARVRSGGFRPGRGLRRMGGGIVS